MDGNVRFGKLNDDGEGSVYLDEKLIALYYREPFNPGTVHWYLTDLAGKAIGSRSQRAGLVAMVKDYASRLSQPVEVTIKLPATLARLVPDLVTLAKVEKDPGDACPILFAMANAAVAEVAAKGRLKFSHPNAVSMAALDIDKHARETIFDIVATALADKPA